ncbi:hypothetical protein [Endozoicomonas sp. ONNA2]|uniref:hypothetical protein n=1 Tax=Endozoicomonas sp. ONNA2 TaxID=2828741 RepID=UPI0021480E80|nr:hypothetical protein [Endozoicomonas sp. ONNA2]
MQTQAKKDSLTHRYIRKTLGKTLLSGFLISSPALYADSYSTPPGNYASPYVSGYADDEPMNDENYGYENYPRERYDHSAWWIAGIGAASVAGLASSSIDDDKKQHFGISMALGAASEFGLRQLDIATEHRWGRIALATGIGMVPGVLKELADDRKENNKFDKNDLLADALGSFAGALLSDLIQGPADTGPRYGVVIGVDEVGLAVNYPF